MCIRWLISGALEREPRGRTRKFIFLDPYYIGYIKRTFITRKKLPPYLYFPRILFTFFFKLLFKLNNLLLFIYLYIFIYFIYFYILYILYYKYFVRLLRVSRTLFCETPDRWVSIWTQLLYVEYSNAARFVNYSFHFYLWLYVSLHIKKNIQSDSWECTSAKQKRADLDYKRSIWATIYVTSRYTVRAEFGGSGQSLAVQIINWTAIILRNYRLFYYKWNKAFRFYR